MFVSKFLLSVFKRDIRSYSVIANSYNLILSQETALAEQCILVNENDKPIGVASKHDCHKIGKNGNLLLHRAFSVFIFNSKSELLMQRRSPYKITFPNFLTNACCSHPLYNLPAELDEEGGLGVRIAAQRRLNHELGIPLDQITPNLIQYLTRIHYKANGSGLWGEHEIDYILVLQRDVDLNPNQDEVSEVCYVSRNDLDSFIENMKGCLTPWFLLVAKNHLRNWWDNLDNLEKFKDHSTIHKFC